VLFRNSFAKQKRATDFEFFGLFWFSIVVEDGIVLAAEKKVVSPLLEPSASSDKMFKIDEHVAAAVAGITSDANILVNNARTNAQRYRYQYRQPQPVEQLVQSLCDLKQGYTQFGGKSSSSNNAKTTSARRMLNESTYRACAIEGLRPFGVSFLFAGYDEYHGLQLCKSIKDRENFGNDVSLFLI
jgi:20S proteasome subunit alpha 3